MSMTGFPTSILIVLHKLTTKGPMTPKQIRGEVNMSQRTISTALRRLTDDRLCRRMPNLQDMRQPLYYADVERIKELQISFDQERILRKTYLNLG
ncbi:MAG: MarR family transcriptional regulator [Candidatus Thorarchaeota archaeon]